MNKKFFKRYNSGGYWEPIEVFSDGEIQKEKDWADLDFTVNGMKCVSVYQCHNPEVCVEDYMEKQWRLDELYARVHELEAEQSILEGLLSSKMPTYKPVLFGDIIATMDEEGTILFQKAILPTEL